MSYVGKASQNADGEIRRAQGEEGQEFHEFRNRVTKEALEAWLKLRRLPLPLGTWRSWSSAATAFRTAQELHKELLVFVVAAGKGTTAMELALPNIAIDIHGRPCLHRCPQHLGLRDVTLSLFIHYADAHP